MERMGDILARTASRRARPARPADSAASPADSPPPVVGATGIPQMPSGGRPPSGDSAGRQIRPARNTPVPSRALPACATGPARSLVTRPLAQPDLVETPPGIPSAVGRIAVPADVRPDVLAGDRILELPPRRATAIVRASASADGGQDPAPPAPRRTSPPDALESSPRGAADVNRPRSAAHSTPTGGRNGSPLREAASNYMSDAPARLGHAATGGAAPCPICGGAGYLREDIPIEDPGFGKPIPCTCKERQNKERERRKLDRLSGLDLFRDKTFDTFDPSIQGIGEAFEVARKFADECNNVESNQWLMLNGPYGVGKTHLAAAIANYRFAKGDTVLFSIVPDLLDHLRATFAPSSEVLYDELFDRIREAGLLVLDDLGAENGTAWATEKIFQLINYRYNSRIPTVVTTNARLFTQMDDRIRSRLSDLSLVRHCVIKAQDYRERHVGNRGRPGGGSGSGSRGRPAYGHGR